MGIYGGRWNKCIKAATWLKEEGLKHKNGHGQLITTTIVDDSKVNIHFIIYVIVLVNM